MAHVPFIGCLLAPGDSALAFWVGDYFWTKAEILVLVLYYVGARPENFVSEYSQVRTNVLGKCQFLGKYSSIVLFHENHPSG